MKALYAARIEDLGPGDYVKAQCLACGHETLMPQTTLLHGLHLSPHSPILDLEPRLRCRECDAKGKALVTVKWAS